MMNQATPTRCKAATTLAGRRFFALTGLAIGAGSFLALLGWAGVTAFQGDARPVALAATDGPIDRPSVPWGQPMGDRPAPHLATNPYIYEEVGGQPEAQHHSAAAAPQHAIQQPPVVTDPPAGVKRDRNGRVIMVNGQPWTGEVFDYRPIRQVRTRTMRTTAYSPDARSCGKWADGITASGRSVWMNGGRLVAADRSIPYGTILTIPGYNGGKPVQVWDRGGAIKGNRLDLLYPTHEVALQWGVQDLRVVFWEFVQTD